MGFAEPRVESESYKHSKSVLIDAMKAVREDLSVDDEAEFELALDRMTLKKEDIDSTGCQLI